MENPLYEAEKACEKLAIADEEEQGFEYKEDDLEKDDEEESFKFCMVGFFMTESHVPYKIMCDTLSNLWKPRKGIYIKKVLNNRFLFQFFHEVDFRRIVGGGPWTFKNHLLVWKEVVQGMDLAITILDSTTFWVQVHDIPIGFRSEKVSKDVGTFVGGFESCDPRNFDGNNRSFLRVRAQVNIYKPLKRFMKLRKVGGEWFQINFKYEKLPTFYFICGIISHGDMFCKRRYEENEPQRLYGLWLRA